jgi:hypothetical protein
VRSWTLYELISSGRQGDIINRTNNPCEAFNSRLNRTFPTSCAHPTMMSFIEHIRSISNEYVEELRIIQHAGGRRGGHKHKEVSIPQFPPNYDQWRAPRNNGR